jgi:hypothetical protein
MHTIYTNSSGSIKSALVDCPEKRHYDPLQDVNRKGRDVARSFVICQCKERGEGGASQSSCGIVGPRSLGLRIGELRFSRPLSGRLLQRRYPPLLQSFQVLLHPAGHGVVLVAPSISHVSYVSRYTPFQDIEE